MIKAKNVVVLIGAPEDMSGIQLFVKNYKYMRTIGGVFESVRRAFRHTRERLVVVDAMGTWEFGFVQSGEEIPIDMHTSASVSVTVSGSDADAFVSFIVKSLGDGGENG